MVIAAGEEVYVELKGRMLSGRVTEVGSQTQYEVAFEDGSVCSNLTGEDLAVSQTSVSAASPLSLSLSGSSEQPPTPGFKAEGDVE